MGKWCRTQWVRWWSILRLSIRERVVLLRCWRSFRRWGGGCGVGGRERDCRRVGRRCGLLWCDCLRSITTVHWLRDGIGQLCKNWVWIGNDYVLNDRTRDGTVRDGSQRLMLLSVQRWPSRPLKYHWFRMMVLIAVNDGSPVDEQRLLPLNLTITCCCRLFLRLWTIAPLKSEYREGRVVEVIAKARISCVDTKVEHKSGSVFYGTFDGQKGTLYIVKSNQQQ